MPTVITVPWSTHMLLMQCTSVCWRWQAVWINDADHCDNCATNRAGKCDSGGCASGYSITASRLCKGETLTVVVYIST